MIFDLRDDIEHKSKGIDSMTERKVIFEGKLDNTD